MTNFRRSLSAPALVLLAVAALLAGCGSSSSSSSSGNGVESKSATQILQAAHTAASKATSVHIKGTINSGGKPVSLDMELLAGKGGKGNISQEGFTIKLIQTGGSVYINGSSAFYNHVAGSAAAQLLQGKWLKAPADSGELASLAELTNLSKLLDTALSDHGTLAKGSVATVEGQKAIGLNDTTKGGTLYVATSGEPFPLEIMKAGKETGKVVLSSWNQPVTLSAPSGAIDISKLQKGG